MLTTATTDSGVYAAPRLAPAAEDGFGVCGDGTGRGVCGDFGARRGEGVRGGGTSLSAGLPRRGGGGGVAPPGIVDAKPNTCPAQTA